MHAYTQRIFQEKFLIDVAKDEKKKKQNKKQKMYERYDTSRFSQ